MDDAKGFIDKNYFIKNYPWEYEREFRLVFIVKKGMDVKKLKVMIPDEIYRKLKVMIAP